MIGMTARYRTHARGCQANSGNGSWAAALNRVRRRSGESRGSGPRSVCNMAAFPSRPLSPVVPRHRVEVDGAKSFMRQALVIRHGGRAIQAGVALAPPRLSPIQFVVNAGPTPWTRRALRTTTGTGAKPQALLERGAGHRLVIASRFGKEDRACPADRGLFRPAGREPC
jgi:hypothetical protein